jgi:RecA/RadA recombinase
VHAAIVTCCQSHQGSPHQIGVMYGNPEVTSGGNALKFYASVRLEVRRKLTLEGAKGEHIGIRVKAKARVPARA